MVVKAGREAADTGGCDHIIEEAVPVCHNSLRDTGRPQFLAVTSCLRVSCRCVKASSFLSSFFLLHIIVIFYFSFKCSVGH